MIFSVLLLNGGCKQKEINLYSKKVVNSGDDDIDCCVVSSLCPQVVLEVCKRVSGPL